MNDIKEFQNVLDDEHRLDNIRNINTPAEKTGDYDRWTGYVVENNDPLRLGRVQIRIIGVYDDIPDYLLPWAVPDVGFVGSMRGSFMIPEPQTMLRGYFDKGDTQIPVYDAVAYSKTNIQSKHTKRAEGNDYPNKLVFFETNDGDYLTLNRKNGELVFTHRTGAQTKIDTQGNITISTGYTWGPSNLKINVMGNADIYCKGKAVVNGFNGVSILADNPAASINIGNNPAKQLINNFTNCLICGAPHTIGNTQGKV